jgi:anthranilate synthase
VKTLRAGFPATDLSRHEPDLVVLSPGPGRPRDFGLDAVLAEAERRALPVFGVCLGLQAIAEACGAELGVLPEPVHGKRSRIRVLGGRLLHDLPEDFEAGRYHSLHVLRDSLPEALALTAVDEGGVVMAVEHQELAWSGVQFHPESILTSDGELGLRLIESCVRVVPVRPRDKVSHSWQPGR